MIRFYRKKKFALNIKNSKNKNDNFFYKLLNRVNLIFIDKFRSVKSQSLNLLCLLLFVEKKIFEKFEVYLS